MKKPTKKRRPAPNVLAAERVLGSPGVDVEKELAS